MVAGQYVALELAPSLHRVELPASALGLTPPPVYTELDLRPQRDGWQVQALAARDQADGIAQWLRGLGATDPRPVAGREPGVRARLPRLPPVLDFASGMVKLQRVGVGSDGSAFLVAAAARGKFTQFLHRIESQRLPHDTVPELTARQAELLQFCKDRGYYEIPRRVTLRDLAQDLGISPTALSKALRRAEARILSAYVERIRHSLPRRGPGARAKRSP